MPPQANAPEAARQSTKACRKCGIEKSLGDFYPHRGARVGKHGVQAYCKDCSVRDSVARGKTATPEQIERKKAWKRQWYKTAKGKASLAANARRYKAKNPFKAKVRKFTALAVELGFIDRPDHCSSCGVLGYRYENGRFSIEAHHPDHSRPLDVEWLCVRCHRIADRELVAKEDSDVVA